MSIVLEYINKELYEIKNKVWPGRGRAQCGRRGGSYVMRACYEN